LTFLNPSFLFGLAGMAIPLVIHLLSRRSARRVEFSSLQFLRDLERKSLRRVRVRQWLLLLARMLLIGSVATAMARPALTGGAVGEGKARTSAVLVLDGSFSMAASGNGTSLFALAKERALEVLRTLEDGDEVVLLVPGARGQGSPEFAHDLAFVREQIAGASPGAAAADLAAVLRDAFRALRAARHPNREVHVVSDFQRTSWEGLEERAAPEGVGVFLHPVGGAAPPNAWVESVDFGGQILEKGAPIELRVVVAAGEAHPRSDVDVEVEFDGRVADRRRVDLAPGARVALSLRETFARDGLHLGAIVVRGATGPGEDDRRSLTLRTHASVPVLLVSGDDQARRYLEAALAPPGGGAGSFAVRLAEPEALETASRSREAVVILVDVERPGDRALDGIKAFLSEGGGVLVIPGPRTDAAAWSRGFLSRFLPGSITGLAASAEPFRVEQLDPSHALFELFREGEGGLRDVRFTRALRVRPEAGTSVLASFANGDPAVLESALLPGRVLLFASSLDPAWSDLPLTGAFLPFLHEAVRYLSEARGAGAERLDVGGGATLRLPTPPASPVSLIAPDGSSRGVAAEPGPSGYALTLAEAFEPGFFVFRTASGDTLGALAASIAARESDFARVPPEEIEDRLAARGAVVASGGDAAREIEIARHGREIGRAFLWGAALLLLAEAWLARRGRPAAEEAAP
jgi:hypothetical protein